MRVRLELDVGVQAQIVEVGGHAGLLHVGIEMHVERQLAAIARWSAAERDSSAKDVRASEGSMASMRGVQGGVVVGDFAHHLHARSECQHLGALARRAIRRPRDLASCLACVQAVAGAHAERIVDGQHGDFAGALARAERCCAM